MEDDGERDDCLTPFWLQTTADLRRGDRLRRSVSAVLFSPGLVVFLLLVAAAAFLLVLLPSTLSLTANVFRPNGVKKSWDSINIVLVLVAVVFGFLSRNKNDDRYSDGEFRTVSGKQFEADEKYVQKSEVASYSPRHWYVFSQLQDRSEGGNSFNLRKNSSSYPDLREFSYGDYQRRFFDDNTVDSDRIRTQAQNLDRTRTHRRHRSMEEVEILRAPPQTKTIAVDTLLSKAKEAADSGWIRTQAQDLDPARIHSRHRSMEEVEILRAPPQTKTIAVVDTLLSKAKEAADSGWIRTQAQDLDPARIHRRHRSMEEVEILRAPPQAKTIVVDTLLSKAKEAADSPAEENRRSMNRIAAVPRKERSRRPGAKSPPPSPRKRGGATANATKDFLNSIYHKKKKTKQRQKSVDNLDSLHTPATYQIPPPPPPPPPPSPPSVLHNLFSSKKQKRKRTIKVIVAPPAQNPNPQISPSPAAQVRSTNPINIHTVDEASNRGGESPLHRAPPPPPPPPPPFFKTTPAWRFVVQGDYVRVNSSTSSRSGSPDLDELDSDVTPSSTAAGDVTPFHPSPLFCPSPDVDTKAESFISSFRAKLKLEKAHSMKKREPGLSTLGPR